MADITPVIETMENRWMRAWVQRDVRALRAATARSFILLMASKPPVILDQKSWLEAAGKRYICTSFRFGDIHVRDLGGVALFASQLELKATMDGNDWSGQFWVTDLWTKGRVRRNWRMAERVVSVSDGNPDIPAAIRALQLWRSGQR
jgi:ketosteroid isomerase-like protein